MAFENLSNKLQEVFKQLRSKGVLTEADVKAAMREVKIALLEADVNFKIVKEFIKKVTERAVGTEVLQGLNPGQQVIKIVNEELIALMGSTQAQLTFSRKPPTVFMMVGLQGAGKTTTSGKLAGSSESRAEAPCWLPATFTDLRQSSSCRWLGKITTFPYLKWAQRSALWKFQKKHWSMRHSSIMMLF